MDSIHTALSLVTDGCWIASRDLTDAHYGVKIIDILYTLDSAYNYSAIQKLKPWLQTQDIPMKWEDFLSFLFLKQAT
jgi:hypothetical protein